MSDQKEALFPIRTVSELTGVNPITLRAWERRHGLVQPQRTAKGHRLYSMQDVEFIHQVLGVLKQGISIGQVRHLLGTSKAPLHIEGSIGFTADSSAANAHDVSDEGNLWENYRHTLQKAIEQFNTAALDHSYQEMISQYPLSLVRQQLLIPLLQQTAAKGQNLAAASGEYHFFSQYLHNRIAANYLNVMLKKKQAKHSKGLLMACFSAQDCAIHLMLLGTELATQGYYTVLLGNDVPADTLPLSLSRSKLDGLLLYDSNIDKMDFARLHALVATVDRPVFIIGRASAVSQKKLATMNTIYLAEDKDEIVQDIIRKLKRET